MLKQTHYFSHVLRSGKRQTLIMKEFQSGLCTMGIRSWVSFDEAYEELESHKFNKFILDRTHVE